MRRLSIASSFVVVALSVVTGCASSSGSAKGATPPLPVDVAQSSCETSWTPPQDVELAFDNSRNAPRTERSTPSAATGNMVAVELRPNAPQRPRSGAVHAAAH